MAGATDGADMIRVVDPATEQVIAAYEEHSPAGIEAVVVQARLAQRAWGVRPPHARARLLASVAAVFRTRVDEYAELITREVGKPLTEARAEVDKCVRVCEYYAAEGERLLADEAVETGTARSFVAYEPLGVVLAVMPWNYPFWQVVRFAAPTLMAGNAGLVKHAPNASGCALAVEGAFRSAGARKACSRAFSSASAQLPRRPRR